jgi:hypothetical protein
MALIPFSREMMRTLKERKDEEVNNMKIDFIVNHMYNNAVYLAEKNADTIYRYMLIIGNNHYGSVMAPSIIGRGGHSSQITTEDIVLNKEEILTRLRGLFPDCVVEYKKVSMVTGRDGKEYDVSALDDKVRPFIDIRCAKTNEYIVIDWS